MPQRVSTLWNQYKLEVMRGGILVCTVQVYLMKTGTYMVEFKRGQLDIFQFKRFYEDVREKLSAMVKQDESLQLLSTNSTARPSPRWVGGFCVRTLPTACCLCDGPRASRPTDGGSL